LKEHDQHGHTIYNADMKGVKVSELKARLSAHLRVREGEEVLICHRNRLVARIVPVSLQDQTAQERRLAVRGLLVPPLKRRPALDSWPNPPGNVSSEVAERASRAERENR
jgi:prevent-host-death family protein